VLTAWNKLSASSNMGGDEPPSSPESSLATSETFGGVDSSRIKAGTKPKNRPWTVTTMTGGSLFELSASKRTGFHTDRWLDAPPAPAAAAAADDAGQDVELFSYTIIVSLMPAAIAFPTSAVVTIGPLPREGPLFCLIISAALLRSPSASSFPQPIEMLTAWYRS
jgi:hypothetical protein